MINIKLSIILKRQMRSLKKSKSWIVIFPLISITLCVISFFFPVLSLRTIIYNPLPLGVVYSLTLFGFTTGNLEIYAELEGYDYETQLLKIPGVIIGVIILVCLIISITLYIIYLLNKLRIKMVLKSWLILGFMIFISTCGFIILWSFIGSYMLLILEKDALFWLETAQIGFSLILMAISGGILVSGFFILKIMEYNTISRDQSIKS